MKEILFRVSAATLSILFIVAGLEIVVRRFNLCQPRIGQQDAILGWSYIPGQTAINENGIKIEIGDHGFRGPSPEIEKKPGEFRVILLGDSFLHAGALDYEKTFYDILQRRFRSKGIPIEVINMGSEGFGTVQEYLVYHHIAKQYMPDLVVLFFYVGNDLWDNYPLKLHRPHYKVVNENLEYVPFKVKGNRRNIIRDFFRKHIRVYTYLPDLFRAAKHKLILKMSPEAQKQEYEEHFTQFKRDSNEDRSDLRAGEKDAPPADMMASIEKQCKKEQSNESELIPKDESWDVTLRIINKLNNEVLNDGALLTVCVIPSASQVHDRYWKLLCDTYKKFNPLGWDRFKPQKIIENYAIGNGIEFFPLSRRMAEYARKSNVTYYKKGDYHWNEEGHALVAEVLEPMLKKAYKEAYRKGA